MLLDVLTGELTFVSLKPCDLSKCTKEEIRRYFINSYNLNESIFVGLKDESVIYKCPDRLRLPLIFYYGHTATVYVNKLILAGLIQPADRVDIGLETLLETGVDEMSWDDTENYRMGGKFQWPALSEVVDFRRKVKQLVLEVIDRTPLQLPITQSSPWWAVMMGMEHERIHLETSSVLIRQLPVSMVTPPAEWITAPSSFGKGAGLNDLIKVEPTTVTYGKPWNFPSYGWDNEYGKITNRVGAFEASRFPVSNKEFLQFVLDGGYENAALWGDEGRSWVQYRQVRHPPFWVCDSGCRSGCGADLATYSHCKPQPQPHCNGHIQVDGNGHHGSDEGGGQKRSYRLRCMYDVIDMPWDWPVEVNYLEAKAFCAWKGSDYRLLCEAEFNVIRGNDHSPELAGTSCDIIFQDKIPANLNLQYGSSTPVNMHPPSALGFHDVSGNVWEWVEDHFNGLPGFATHAYYDDFSSPTFDGKHNMILGGSWVSTGDEASRFARYAFRRHFVQHCGFRVARSVKTTSSPDDVTPLPVAVIDKGVYVLGFGVNEISVMLDRSQYSYEPCESRNLQYSYEHEEVLNEMLRLEYTPDCTLSHVITNKVTSVLRATDVKRDRALHLGSGTGYCTFKLSKHFKEVLGQDFCARFIHACQEMQNNKVMTFTGIDGFKKFRREIALPDNIHADRISFAHLTWLSNEVGSFDFVLSTCFDRTMNTAAWLLRLPEVIRDGGLLVAVSAGQYDERALQPYLSKSFELLEANDVTYQQFHQDKSVRVTVWRRLDAVTAAN